MFGTPVYDFHRTQQQMRGFESLLEAVMSEKMRQSALMSSGLYKFACETIVATSMFLQLCGYACKAHTLKKWYYSVCLRIRRRRVKELKSVLGMNKNELDDIQGYFVDENASASRLEELISQSEEISFDVFSKSLSEDTSSSPMFSTPQKARSILGLSRSSSFLTEPGEVEEAVPGSSASSSSSAAGSVSSTAAAGGPEPGNFWFSSYSCLDRFTRFLLELNYTTPSTPGVKAPNLFKESEDSMTVQSVPAMSEALAAVIASVPHPHAPPPKRVRNS